MVGFGKKEHTYTLYCNGIAINYYVLSTDNDIAIWEVDSNENSQYLVTKSDESEVTVITSEIITEKGYDLQVKEVKCWWADITINNEASVDTQLENVDEADDIDSGIINKLLNGTGIEETSEEILENVTNEKNLVSQSNIYRNDSDIFKESEDTETDTGEKGFLNSIYNYIKDNKDPKYMKKKGETNDNLVGTMGYEEVNKTTIADEGININSEVNYDTMDVLKNNRKEKYCTIKQTRSVTYGIPSGDYELSGVLALLKDSNGDPIEYRDIYDRNNSDNSTIAPGEMLVNGAEMTFELLDSSENTEGLSDVMRYLLYLYSGNDYGVTNANFGMFNDLSFMGTSSVIMGNTIQEKVWYGLKNMGFSDISIAAAMGNIHYESGTFNPEAVESGYDENNGGIGICQWTNSPRESGNGRNAQLKKYAQKKGTTWKDPDVQAEFLMAELTPSGGANGCASYQLSDTTYAGDYKCSVWKEAKDTETLDKEKLKELTEIFMFTFERPSVSAGNSSLKTRYDYAVMYYNTYHGKSLSGGTEGESDAVNGVTARFTSNITGRTFTVWRQGSVGLSGQCNRAAAATIASGYRAAGESESSVLSTVKSAGDCVLSNASSTQNFFYKYGLKAQINEYSYSTTNIKNLLTNGKYICLWINMEGSGKSGIGKSGTKYCNLNGIHWIAIIGYNSKDGKEQIYVADPGGFSGATGWHDLDEFNVLKSYIKYFTVISEKK